MRSQLVALVTATSLTGCSLAFTRGPKSDPQPNTPQLAVPDCTHSMAWPAVDGIVGAIALLAVAGAISDSNDKTQTEAEKDDTGGTIAAGIIVAGVAGASALVGYSRVNKCRKANELYAASYQYNTPYGQVGPPQGYAYPQQYPQQPQYQYPPQPQYGQQPVYTPVYPQPQPVPQPQPMAQPVAQPIPAPAPVAAPPVAAQPKPAPPAARPKPPAPPADLGTEGDVCTTQAECATGFSCTGNVCLKKK